MKLIGILVSLLMIGLIIYKQLGTSAAQRAEQAQAIPASAAPDVPTDPRKVNQFGKEMNQYMLDEASKRAAELEQATSR